MKKKLFILGLALASTFALASCGDEAQSGNDKTDVVDNGENNQGENNQGENNQGENNQGENNQGGEDEHKHDLLRRKAIEATYTSNGQVEHYKCVDCGKLFDADGKEITQAETFVPALTTKGEIVSINEDGSLVTNVSTSEFKEHYDGKFVLNISFGKDTYQAPTVRWIEEVVEGNAGILSDGETVVLAANKANLADLANVKVGDKFEIGFVKKGYTSQIRAFNYLTQRSAVTLNGRDFEITFDDEKKAEIDALIASILEDIAGATPTEENPTPENPKDYDTVDAAYKEFVDYYYYLIDEYRYASIKADTTAAKEDYDKQQEILDYVNDLEVEDQKIDIAMAKSIYRNLYFADMTDEEIDDYIAELDPDTSTTINAYQSAMESAKNDYYSGVETDAFKALTTYVDNATEFAKLKGYNDYLEYAYKNVYGREYKYTDSNSLNEYIVNYIVPIYEYTSSQYTTYSDGFSTNPADYSSFISLYSDFYGFYFDQIEAYAKIVGGDYEKNFKAYFVDGNYFYSANPNDNVTGYVSSFADGTPLMFLGPDRSADGKYIYPYQSISTFIHEFGHFNAKATKGDNGSYDLAETQSQGNELLFFTYFSGSGVLPERQIQAYMNYMLMNMSHTVLKGYLVNEFEKYLYTCDIKNATLADFKTEWNKIVKDSNLTSVAGTIASSVEDLFGILLNYQGYYISYSTSAVAALELYAAGLKNYDNAIASYREIFAEHTRGEDTFTSVLEKANLYGVFDEEAYQLIASAFPNAFAN